MGRLKKDNKQISVHCLPEKAKEVREYAKIVSESGLINEIELLKLGFKKETYDEGAFDYILASKRCYLEITESLGVYVRDSQDNCFKFPNCKTMFDIFKLMDMLNF